ncbi:hypothetical protein ZIOFF_000845 [Zingiber officinale]|uniref:Hcy-binding domain-containing protein n=1 Tax=Zingiber officinale TaxID=94328 RepID=A0A8J5LY30_ZINOF|nr:hypothetical protein ZIOFF_000845 [Zingiber officinale]
MSGKRKRDGVGGRDGVDMEAIVCEGAINLKQRPVLVAASIGSYGAYLADGSEYSGNYGQEITVEIVKDFHRRRLEVLSEAGADIIAFETIPNKLEAQVSFDVFVELSNGSCSSFVAHLAKTEIQNRAYVELLLECDTKILLGPKVARGGVNSSSRSLGLTQ